MTLDEHIDSLGPHKGPIAMRAYIFMHLISEAAVKHDLPTNVLAGLVCQESGAIAQAIRYEPDYRWINRDVVDHPPSAWRMMSRATRENIQKYSLGPCQIMVGVALERGFRGYPVNLCDWRVGLEFGARHLAWRLRRDGDIGAALMRYNGGGDPDYPRRVMRWASLLAPIVAKSRTDHQQWEERKAGAV